MIHVYKYKCRSSPGESCNSMDMVLFETGPSADSNSTCLEHGLGQDLI
jgi:hypothetical protein